MDHNLVRRLTCRYAVCFATISALSLAACTSSTGPSSPIAGAWRTVPIPSGSGIDLSLVSAGNRVTGRGHEYTLQYLADSLTVTGRTQLAGTFQLTLTFGSGLVATYDGQFVGADQLDGVWTTPSQSYRLAFYRQTP